MIACHLTGNHQGSLVEGVIFDCAATARSPLVAVREHKCDDGAALRLGAERAFWRRRRMLRE